MPAPSSLPHPHRALTPEMRAVTSEWISLTVGVPGRHSLALTPPLPPLPEASVYNTDYLAWLARPSPSLPLRLPHSSWSTPRSVVSPLALPAPHKAYSLAPGAQASLHINGDSGFHLPPSGIHQDSFSQPQLVSSDRVISELSDAFSNQGKWQPWREEGGQYERRAESEAGERYPGGPKISKKSCLKPSDVVRCLSTEQRLSDLHTPEESRPSKPLGSPFPGRETEQTELHRGVEQAQRKAARSGVSQVGLQHDVCALVSALAGWARCLTHGSSTETAWMLVRPTACLGSKNITQEGTEGSLIKVSWPGTVGGKRQALFWPQEVIQNLPPLWVPPGLVQRPQRRKPSSCPIRALEIISVCSD